jgi:hypothetical protein
LGDGVAVSAVIMTYCSLYVPGVEMSLPQSLLLLCAAKLLAAFQFVGFAVFLGALSVPMATPPSETSWMLFALAPDVVDTLAVWQ